MPATIHITSNAVARLVAPAHLSKVIVALRFRPDGYKFAPAYRAFIRSGGRYGWDGWACPIKRTGMFDIGHVDNVKKALEKNKVKVVVKDDRVRPIEPRDPHDIRLHADDGDKLHLYPYQRKAVRLALAKGNCVVKAATGGGKTEVMAGMISCLSKKSGPLIFPPKTLLIVPNRTLLKQTVLRLKKRLKMKVGSIGYGKWQKEAVTVAIPDTLLQKKWNVRLRHMMASVQLLLVDECHHAKSQSWFKAVSACKAYYRVGLSATPLDLNQGGTNRLVGLTGPQVAEVQAETLIAMGKLATPTVTMLPVEEPELPAELGYEDAYRLGVVFNKSIHEQIVATAATEMAFGSTILILVTRIEHGELLYDAVKTSVGEKAVRFIHSKSSDKDKDNAKKALAKGKLPILIASPILGEGADIPAIDCLIVADSGKSVIRTIQKAGRALRPKAGANEARIYDFANFTHSYLAKHSLERLAVYAREGYRFT